MAQESPLPQLETAVNPQPRAGSRRWTILFGLVLVLGVLGVLGAFWFGLNLAPAGAESPALPDERAAARTAPQAGAPAPDFSLATLDGEMVTLSDLRGRPVVLNFWATWCGPCRAEMPALEQVWQQYEQGGVMVLGVDQGEQAGTVERFVREEVGTSFPILLDPDQKVGAAYQVRALPTTFFIGADGVIQEVRIGGPLSREMLLQSIWQPGRR